MKNSIKGALLSGLVYPGVGQILLKQYKRGITILAIFSVSLLIIIINEIKQAFAILEKLQSEGNAIDINSISDAAIQTTTTSGNFIITFFLFVMFSCWILGIVDAYGIGRKKDTEEHAAN